MKAPFAIGVWDDDPNRAARIQLCVESVLRKNGIRGYVVVNCEPPQLSRTTLSGRFPALEIGNDFWTLIPGREFTKAEIEALLRRLT